MGEMEYKGLLDDGVATNSSTEQHEVEEAVKRIYAEIRDNEEIIGESVQLLREKHILYVQRGIRHLPEVLEYLEASQPWLCYWMIHSMSLLRSSISPCLAHDVAEFLGHCQSPDGGFGGGPGQLPHLAPTFGAVLALCTVGTKEAYDVINRPALQRFLLKQHQEDGSYIMHADGERDIRGVYCALVCAVLTNTLCSQLIDNTAQWISSCQTYEGGFSSVPGTEAHGGYTFCGLASLVLLKETDLCDIQALLRWATRKQMKLEGGFQGRTNKLVDGCYSFWLGGLFPLIYTILKEKDDKCLSGMWHFNQEALQEYILYCCQSAFGGLLDKPGKHRDFYHTCYCLSGLSVAQHCYDNQTTINISDEFKSVLKSTHPVFNITSDKVQQAQDYFKELLIPLVLEVNP